MAGFQSMDDFIYQTTVNGHFKRVDWNKLFTATAAGTGVAGTWNCHLSNTGNPGSAILTTGASAVFVPLTETTGSQIYHGGDIAVAITTGSWSRSASAISLTQAAHGLNTGDYINVTASSDTGAIPLNYYPVTTTSTSVVTFMGVSTGASNGSLVYVPPGWKHIINASAFSAATTSVPAVFMLIDVLGFYRITTVTTTGSQTLTNSTPLPRYKSGKGVQAMAVCSSALGTTTSTLKLTYTRPSTGGTDTGRTTPFPLPVNTATIKDSYVTYTGTGAGKYGPFIPLASGDNGIVSIDKIDLSSTYTSGELVLILCVPILTLPLTTIGVAAERDLLNQIPSLPKIYDGACLTWLQYNGVATPIGTAYFGHLDFAWS